MASISKDIRELIQNCFQESVNNFEVTLHSGNKKGEGFIGDILFISLRNKRSGEENNVVIKQRLSSKKETTSNFITACYINEIHVYSKLLPYLRQFQETLLGSTLVDLAPKCYCISAEEGKEKIMLDNLKFKGYQTSSQFPLTDKTYEKLFGFYGHYHALSFALKHYQREKFRRLVEPLTNTFLDCKDLEQFSYGTSYCFGHIRSFLLANNEEEISNKLQAYIENAPKMLENVVQYTGCYSVITHGDARTNNILFKYNAAEEVEDIKFIDFQMTMEGTPVYDLSYTFYAGASMEALDNWEHFLTVYYSSLSISLKKYNLEAAEIYPYEELKLEWKKYSRLGYILGVLVWCLQFLKQDEIQDLDLTEGKPQWRIHENETFVSIVLNLTRHFFRNDFL